MRPIAELRSPAILRGRVYSLGQALTGNAPTFALLSRINADPALPLLARELEPVARIAESAAACLRNPAAMKEAEEEYARLYVGPQALPSPLWESVYRDPEHVLFGEATLAVRRFYGRYGLGFSRQGTEPDDHIAPELEFMWHLTSLSVQALDGEDTESALPRFVSLCSDQLDFLKSHLLEWAPQSFTLQFPHAQTGLYAGLARLIAEFLPTDASFLTELLGDISHELE
ncbi:hypothetical protein KL86DPRO_11825 [uncultured delta proteobacterium]|uniref:Cytoplasmic chaperone TorD family protein n=1 Tax=uncultured delta proteobacterium TaxID=34034 RepID=A0A212JMM0_9DELT|nr:hypothetical protein KL86DPRO_11825 [uncultured delta proteobacterium]